MTEGMRRLVLAIAAVIVVATIFIIAYVIYIIEANAALVVKDKEKVPGSRTGTFQGATFINLFERVGNGRERAIQIFAESLHRGDDHN